MIDFFFFSLYSGPLLDDLNADAAKRHRLPGWDRYSDAVKWLDERGGCYRVPLVRAAAAVVVAPARGSPPLCTLVRSAKRCCGLADRWSGDGGHGQRVHDLEEAVGAGALLRSPHGYVLYESVKLACFLCEDGMYTVGRVKMTRLSHLDQHGLKRWLTTPLNLCCGL